MTKSTFGSNGFRMGKLLLILALLFALLPVGAMAITYVDSPMVIEEAGEYQLVKDITDYDGVRWQNGTDFYEPCIKILASDVIFDGNGHTISGNFDPLRYDQVGIYVDAGLERVSVINTNVNGFNYGIYYYAVNQFSEPEMGGRIDSNNVNDNDYGIILDSSQWISVLNNDASATRYIGVFVASSHWNVINSNVADSNGLEGITLLLSDNNVVRMNSANNNNNEGIMLLISNNNTVQSNTANDNINSSSSGETSRGTGIYLTGSSGNRVLDNIATRNHVSGITVFPPEGGEPNIVENNSVSFNGHAVGDTAFGWGIYVDNDQGTTHVNNNHAFNNTGVGIELRLDNGAESGGNLVEGNGVEGILLHGSRQNTLHDNIVRYNHKYGIELATATTDDLQYMSSDSNILSDNEIYGHEVSGVFLNGTDNFEPLIENLLEGNEIYDNGEWGVHFYHANLNTLKENIIHGNGILGIKLDGSGYNVIYDNIFNNSVNAGFGQQSNNPNTWNVLQEPGPNVVGGPYKGGNYWAQPDGHGWSQINPDTKGNGFCDNAFVIGPDNVDNFPLMNPLAVSFSASPTSGNAPLTVNFAGTVGSQTGNQWLWNFGDGSTDTIQNPTHVYSSDGIYTVSLTAYNDGWSNTTTRTGYVLVGIAPPQPDFVGSPVTGTFPLTVFFTDQSLPNSGQYAVNSWDWDFGDGTTHSSLKNPVHVYQTAGTYTVNLTVTSLGGTRSAPKSAYITSGGTPGPTAAFTMDKDQGPFPLKVRFIDQSTGSPPLTYFWDFDDGGITSTDKNPEYEYDTAGTYHVTLTVTNAGGTSVSEPSTVVVTTPTPPFADFTGSPRSGTKPLKVQFVDLSLNNPTSWLWEFGDGNTSTEKNPEHIYYAFADYTVKLTATNAGGSDQSQKTEFVSVQEQPVPVADFTDDISIGYAPLTVTFTDSSTGQPSSWFWSFGDGTYSSTKSPVHTFTSPGEYDVSLVVTNQNGQSAPVTHIIVVSPFSQFVASPSNGDSPLEVHFTDVSSGNPTSWYWIFGDGNTSTQQNPVHTFTNPDPSGYYQYTVGMWATSNGVEDPAPWTEKINVGPVILKADFNAIPDSGYAPLDVQFSDQSTGNVNTWLWEFGDDGSYATTQNAQHNYTKSGVYSVNLRVTSSLGEVQTKTKQVIVNPRADFTIEPSEGVAPQSVQFTDTSTGSPIAWNWYFSDGSESTEQNPVHIFQESGMYWVTLNVTGADNLYDETWGFVTVAPKSDFSYYPSQGVSPLSVQFVDTSVGTPNSWNWNFGDGVTSSEQSPVHIYQNLGEYPVTLTSSYWGIQNTVQKTIHISNVTTGLPTAAFTAVPPSGSVPLMVTFVDQSMGNPTSWSWNFGDGATSTDRNPAHMYTTSGTKTATLTVTNAGGNSSTSQFIAVNAPSPVSADFTFTAIPSSYIEPVTLQFMDTSSGGPTSWEWDFGDGTTHSNLQSPVHVYSHAGNYTPMLTVSNSLGQNTKIYNGKIWVRHTVPIAAFSASPTTGYAPFSVTFTDQTNGQALLAWDWNFGDGGTSQTKSPVYTYNSPGVYSVTLKSYNDGGWSAPITKTNLITVIAAPPTPPANVIKLYPGWNFVSTPKKLAPGSDQVNIVFGGVDMDHHSPLLFNGQTKQWIQFISGTVKPLDGIWIYSKYQTDVTLQFDTTSLPQPPSKSVYTGWNAVGESGVNAISARDDLLSLGSNWNTLIGYNSTAQSFETAIIRGSTDPRFSDSRLIYPTHGYWLSMGTNDTLEGIA